MKTALSLLLGVMVLVAVGMTVPTLNAAQSGASTSDFIVEYPIPTANSNPRSIVIESPGHVWFTMPGANAIGSLVVTSTVDYEFTSYAVPTANGEPYDLASDGTDLWFTERAANKIGRLNLATKGITEYTIPTPNSSPTGIDVAPDGQIWFTERDGNKLGRFDPIGATFTEISYTTAGGQLEHIAVAGDGRIWFTAPPLHRVVEYRPSNGTFINIPVLTVFGGATVAPGGLVTDSSGMPWTSASDVDWVGRYAPGTLAYWRWQALVLPDGYPTALAYSKVGTRNHVWFVATNGGRVGQVVTTAAGNFVYLREHSLPTANSQPRGIAVDANGHVWITESGSNKIAEWLPPYFHQVDLPIILRSQ